MFRHLTPREGTETPRSYPLLHLSIQFRYPTPREGTETSVIATTFVTVGLGLDTYFP